jgi:hypothetical protein
MVLRCRTESRHFFFLRFIIIFPYKKTHLIQTFPFLWLASTSASSFPSARLLYAISLILQVKEKIMIIKGGRIWNYRFFNQKKTFFFPFSFAYTQRIQSSNREKGNRQKRKNGFPFLLILFPLAFSRFSYAKRTASLPSSVTPDIQRLWKAYPFERNPTSWVPSHPHGYSPGESFPPFPYRTVPPYWIPP